ncbi:MAG: class F sortase [Candidatus Colwellbacteria bacterium]
MKFFLRKQLLVIIVAGFAFSLFVFLHSAGSFNQKSVWLNSIKSDMALLIANTADPYQQEQAKSQLPVRLKIPSINVDATIEYKGLTPEGAMDIPEGPDDVAWFSLGTYPGENGSAVIAGHTNWKNGRAAVFDNLHELDKGDEVQVIDDKGRSISFIVRESRIYDAEAYAPEVFVSDNGKHLNLVTCVGVWDESKKSYTKRLVVFTDSIK